VGVTAIVWPFASVTVAENWIVPATAVVPLGDVMTMADGTSGSVSSLFPHPTIEAAATIVATNMIAERCARAMLANDGLTLVCTRASSEGRILAAAPMGIAVERRVSTKRRAARAPGHVCVS
jgi:hypothetical protein